jgi:transcription antitermination factor NusA-like protein
LVKTELCSFCVKSGILCSKCQERLDKGRITQLDLKVIRLLSELEKHYPGLQEVHFHKAVEIGDTMAIMVERRDIGQLMDEEGRLLRAIGEQLGGKKIKVLGYGGDDRRLMEELLAPLAILTINTVWLPDGSKETKTILQGRTPRHMPVDLEAVKQLAKEIQGITLRIEFERQ